MEGRVVKSTGSWYIVRTGDGVLHECRMKGLLRISGNKSTNPVAVGDLVIFEPEKGGRGVISEVKDRKNYMIRRSTNLSRQTHVLASNIDMAWLFVTLRLPRTSEGFVDRFLLTAEAYSIPVTLLFNKKDIYGEDEMTKVRELMELYKNIGYETRLVSAYDEEDVRSLSAELKDSVNLFAGHSGTGKSTFINALNPVLSLKTAEVSEAHSKGKHTTTFAEMHVLPGGGFVIDTPGIKEFGIVNLEREEVSHFFPEIFRTARECRFSTCLHLQEPGCAVIKAVEEGKIAFSRYNSYAGLVIGDELDKKYPD